MVLSNMNVTDFNTFFWIKRDTFCGTLCLEKKEKKKEKKGKKLL